MRDWIMSRNFFFDKQDREILKMINEIIERGLTNDLEQKIFNENLHPHGILELTTTHEYRMAHAIINLLGTVAKTGLAEDRLVALRALRDEVLHSAQTKFRYNTARVLIEIMKKIIRAREDSYTQLKLVHDFRNAAKGNPRVIRSFLDRLHLVEMPEQWNQLTLDHHVHDSNTNGRKNPTYLIMDAWVKGIRYLTVVYYNYVELSAANELLQAAEIMDMDVRIGIEYKADFRGRYINFVWAPRGFSDPQSFLEFLQRPAVVELMQDGREASLYMQKQVFRTLDLWNSKHAPALSAELDIPVPLLDPEKFREFVGNGQPSYLHLAEFTHKQLLPLLREKAGELAREIGELGPERGEAKLQLLKYMDSLTPQIIMEKWISPESNPEIPSPDVPLITPDVPPLLRLDPNELLTKLVSLRTGYRNILQLSGLTAEDVLELLWDCQGKITHLEMFNLKEWQEGNLQHLDKINKLQKAINEGNILQLKQMLRGMIRRMEAASDDVTCVRCDKFRIILHNIPTLQAPYQIAPLRSRIGTDSTSHSGQRHGMGLVIPESLPPKARRQLSRRKGVQPMTLPVRLKLSFRDQYTEPPGRTKLQKIAWAFLHNILGMSKASMLKQRHWHAFSSELTITPNGNVLTMGGTNTETDNGLLAVQSSYEKRSAWVGLPYMNTLYLNILKVIVGLVPAMLTFLHTQNWWFLAFFGAPLWFTITGVRNVAQSVMAGGGFRKGTLLRWNNYVSWSRVSDSLMYTGLSVVLLELLMRSVILQGVFGLSTETAPLICFTVISCANGLYISAHNLFRGLPTIAVVGNMFRSILAIPIAMIYNQLLYLAIPLVLGMPPEVILVPGAAIVTKAASDSVAAIIESVADRRNHLRLRHWDFRTKLQRLFFCYTLLELTFPDRDTLALLSQNRQFFDLTNKKEFKSLQVRSIINSLDLMYFWYYQPCARETLKSILRGMSREERVVMARFQGILLNIKEVSQLFVDGLLGKNFAQALSFYLDNHEDYLIELARLCSDYRGKRKQRD